MKPLPQNEFRQPAPPGKVISSGWPSWRYGPDGQAEVFKREEDVPPGWTDSPRKTFVAPEPKEQLPVERKDVIAALNARGIPFRRNAGTEALYALLKAGENEHGAGDYRRGTAGGEPDPRGHDADDGGADGGAGEA